MRKYGIIGFPLSHSFSPAFFAEKFKRENIHDATYSSYPLAELSELDELLLSEPELCGLNVTIPYKESILPRLHSISKEAGVIGAVNTIRITHRNGSQFLEGFNTDVFGFRQSLKPFLETKHSKALVLGSGGASKAVKFVLKDLGIPFAVISREKGKGDLLYHELSGPVIDSCKLIVNCTPAGMHPHVESLPPLPDFFYSHIGNDHFLFDLIYNPEETLFLKKGRERGALTLNGLTMLHQQAEESWRIWQGN